MSIHSATSFEHFYLCVPEHCMHDRMQGENSTDLVWQSALWIENRERNSVCERDEVGKREREYAKSFQRTYFSRL